MNSNALRAIRIVSVCVIALSFLFGTRLYFLQVVRAEEFSRRGERQYTDTRALFDRGNIFLTTKNGARVPAATLQEGFVLAIHPSRIHELHTTYAALAPVLSITEKEFATLVAHGGNYKEIAHRLTREQANAISTTVEKQALSGVSLIRDRWRFYPGGTSAAHTLGFVGHSDKGFGGRYGLERYWEDTLARTPSSPYANFFSEIFGYFTGEESVGGDVSISLEPSAQQYLETLLARTHENFSARETAGLVMNPKTGEVIALAATPSFDPNTFQREKDWRVFVNPLVENVYEFGSIMKPLTLAAGIDAGTITPTNTYRDAGFLELDGKTIYNFDKKARGVVSMQEVLNQSLNTGAAYVALEMGKETFAEYMRSFGLGSETGVDLPNEARGLVDNLKSPRQIEYATASFGQGIATTPIAMARALSGLANGGELPNPHLATRISYTIGGFSHPSFGEPRRVMKKETAETVTEMLVRVVDEALLDGSLKLDRWSVAAKTGTAQIAKPTGGGYYDDRYLHSFFGYFPAYEPRFLVFLYTVEPKGVTYASHTLAAPFFDIAQFLLNYYAIPPDR